MPLLQQSLDEELVLKAVESLRAVVSHPQSKQKGKNVQLLLDENPPISLVIAVKRIPDRVVRPARIALPHTLFPLEESELCLFSKQGKLSVVQRLETKGVEGVNKVIPLEKLKKNYKSFEAKRQLSVMYDVFLADSRIYPNLGKLLGKAFFVKKKFPFPVNLKRADLVEEFRRARDSTYMHLGYGACINVPIARLSHSDQQVLENILAGVRGIAAKLPKGWANIQSLHIKTPASPSLPIYNSLPELTSFLLPPVEPPAETTTTAAIASDPHCPPKRIRLDPSPPRVVPSTPNSPLRPLKKVKVDPSNQSAPLPHPPKTPPSLKKLSLKFPTGDTVSKVTKRTPVRSLRKSARKVRGSTVLISRQKAFPKTKQKRKSL